MAVQGSAMPTSSPTSIPAASRPAEHSSAAARRSAFPYRFPHETRALGGKFSVEENARRLKRFFYVERRLGQVLGSWTLSIPEFEVKVETGRHIFWHLDAARVLRTRLHEQECRLPVIDGFRDAGIDRLIDEAASAANVPELLVAMHQVLGRALVTAYRHHCDDTCPIADAPTIRVLRHIMLDHEPMLAWADAAVEAYINGGIDPARLAAWRWHLSRVLASIGGITGADPISDGPELRITAKPYIRGTVPQRDSRFLTFTHTGDFDVADGTPRCQAGTYEHDRLHFMRSQRDEVDAIEAFGTFLWDIRFTDFDAEWSLAHITWDESRHTEIGHHSLAAAGYDPYELPNRLTSSTCRGPMEAQFAMAEINLFGEVGVMKTVGPLIERARERQDDLLVHIADFIRSDERTHVRQGQHILKQMTDLDMPTLDRRTREAFTHCLRGLGAITSDDPGWVLSRADIEKLVGE